VRVVVATDGASRGNPGPAAGAAVVYDEAGRPLVRAARYLGQATNNVAEYEGLILGLDEALRLGATEVEVRSDSQLLVRQLRGEYAVRHPQLVPLYRRARAQLARFGRWRAVHVPRAQNAAADGAANEALDRRASFRQWGEGGEEQAKGAVDSGAPAC
jgi:ribonuclease HI